MEEYNHYAKEWIEATSCGPRIPIIDRISGLNHSNHCTLGV